MRGQKLSSDGEMAGGKAFLKIVILTMVGSLVGLGGCTSVNGLPHERAGLHAGSPQIPFPEPFNKEADLLPQEKVRVSLPAIPPMVQDSPGGKSSEALRVVQLQLREGSTEEVEEDFFDPFAEGETDSGSDMEEYDPLESYNSLVFRFNYNADKYVIKPLAIGYNWITPIIVQRGLLNMIQNVRVAPRTLNNLFQGKFRGAGIEVGRFLINSTVGIGGFFDPAEDYLELTTPQEDFGQTLGVYGVGPGPYLLIPLWPTPLTLRDGLGVVADIFLDPFNYLVLPFTTVESWPQVVTNEDLATIANVSIRVGDAINRRSLNLETFQGIEDATLDLYSAVRNAYLQQRARAISE